ncbi:MAG: trigger factor [Candidatus Kerfeldbacteria bacterium]|nr:trigger factor [Candidatus Kerfeldbacteria bacterium]
MERQVENIVGGQLRITFTLTPEEASKFESRALRHLSESANFAGFRPGHAPLDLVRQRFGVEVLQQETMLQAMQQLYPDYVKQEEIETVGQPEVQLITSPGLSWRVTVARLPEVKLGKWEKVKVKRQPIKVAEAEIEQVLLDIRSSRAAEAAVSRQAKLGDRVEINFEVSMGGVVIDGGQGSKYPVVLGRHQLIPGFEGQLIGLKAEEEKEFELVFPTDYKRDLAGKRVQVRAKVLQVFERTIPELTDEFASLLGQFASAADFKDKLSSNLLEEKKEREEQRLERDLLEELLPLASFGEIAEVLITSEVDKMIHEFKHSLEERGLTWIDYLQNIKKDEASLRVEFKTPALKRVKLALLIRAFAKQHKLEAAESAVEEEIEHALHHAGGDERLAARLRSGSYREYLKHVLTNQLVIKWLKEKLVG